MITEEFEGQCKKHGLTKFVITGTVPRQRRCKKCRVEGVTERRRKTKRLLVEALGGKCNICGYDKCIGALEFHHLSRDSKSFALSQHGVTRSFKKALEEAKKCILLCSNCHKEVEAGITNFIAR